MMSQSELKLSNFAIRDNCQKGVPVAKVTTVAEAIPVAKAIPVAEAIPLAETIPLADDILLFPYQPGKKHKEAVYTHKDGTTERVLIVKEEEGDE